MEVLDNEAEFYHKQLAYPVHCCTQVQQNFHFPYHTRGLDSTVKLSLKIYTTVFNCFDVNERRDWPSSTSEYFSFSLYVLFPDAYCYNQN